MKGINADVGVANMIPFSAMKDPRKKFMIRHQFGAEIPQYKDAEKAAEYLGVSTDDLYIVNNSFYPYCYYKNFLYIDLMNLDLHVLDFTQVQDRIRIGHEEIEKLLSEEKFSALFTLLIDKKISFYAYEQLYDQIPKEQRYEVFMSIYTHNEYGFNKLDKTLISGIFSHRSEEQRKEVLKNLSPFIKDGKVLIYRGEASESTPYEQSYSWTTSLSTAIFFATRYSSKGHIYATEVDPTDIIDFYDGRGESEIILLPEHQGVVWEVQYHSTDKIMKDFKKDGYLSRFNMYTKRILPEHFHNPNGIHAIGHTKRVLFHTLNLCRLEGIPFNEERLLAYAATYHDIGRTHDDVDDEHGYVGYRKMVSLGLGKMDNPDEQEILRYLIDNHCLDDDFAFKSIKDYPIKDKDRALYLMKVFKDADGLDRVRIGDLDANYLRLDESKLLCTFAKDLLRQMS